DSINYAKMIQSAILPSVETIRKNLPFSFIFFKPKDVVSGDFYYYHVSDGVTGSHGAVSSAMPPSHPIANVIVAAADCTGHGVPGAFMSLIGFDALNHIIKTHDTIQPGLILNKLHENICQVLRSGIYDTSNKNGMDIAVCSINPGKYEIQYSGAHIPLYIIRKTGDTIDEMLAKSVHKRISNGKHELLIVKGFAKSIGDFGSPNKLFPDYNLKLSQGDTVYIFSDGFIDQAGGQKKKKYMSKRFRKFLLSIQELDMYHQYHALEQELKAWQGDNEQTDDIVVIGVRMNR
ncbi:MAG: SpoIIE family protein phosphatase, partial [Bacteroidia bacterium]|nr:SpoIIE family protein phosphatase [Bacteroidia bacterium]